MQARLSESAAAKVREGGRGLIAMGTSELGLGERSGKSKDKVREGSLKRGRQGRVECTS